jgi:hypothetical protein
MYTLSMDLHPSRYSDEKARVIEIDGEMTMDDNESESLVEFEELLKDKL